MSRARVEGAGREDSMEALESTQEALKDGKRGDRRQTSEADQRKGRLAWQSAIHG
jgi:hypothetical protein